MISGEQLYQLTQAGPDTPQCVVCNQTAEHKCAACGEQLCGEHARQCEFCKVSEIEPINLPPLWFCDEHAQLVEDHGYFCADHKQDLAAELAAVLDAERVYEEVMA